VVAKTTTLTRIIYETLKLSKKPTFVIPKVYSRASAGRSEETSCFA